MDYPRHTLCYWVISFKMEFHQSSAAWAIHSACSTPEKIYFQLSTPLAPAGLCAKFSHQRLIVLQGESSFKYVESSTNAHQGTDVRANPLHHLASFRGDPFSSKESLARAIHSMRGTYAPGTVLVAENTTQGAHVGAGVLENGFLSFSKHLSL